MASRADDTFRRLDPQRNGQTSDTSTHTATPLHDAMERYGITKALADAICHDEHFARDASDRLYRYHDGVYHRYAERFIQARIKQVLLEADLSQKWTTRRAEEVTTYIRVDAPPLDDMPALNVLNVKNGLIDIQTGTLRPHTHEVRTSIQLPIHYDPTAHATAWETFEQQVLPSDCTDLLFKLAAWLMLPHTHIQKAVLLLGEGGNGKSTLLGALRAFIGKQHTTSIPLQKLEADKFSLIRVFGKLVNICPDLPSTYLETTSTFKALTGFNDMMEGERKYIQDTIEFTPFCRLLFSANRPPRSSDDSQGFFDRWLVVPCEAQFRGTTQEIRPDEIAARLSAPAALSGALNKALQMLPSLRADGIPLTDSMQKAFAEFRETTDPLAVWLDRETMISMGAFIPKDDLVTAYNRECERRNRGGVTKTSFTQALKRLKPLVEEKRRTVDGQEKVRVYNDLAWRRGTHEREW